MSNKFERPIGAAADVRELEYVAALHQTDDADDDKWMDGSIEATDVKNFLLSRYGVQVTKQEVRDLIFADMGGGNDEDECIDLTEVVAILLIPYLAKIDWKQRTHEALEENDSCSEVSTLQSQFEKTAYNNSKLLRKTMKDGKSILTYLLKLILQDVRPNSMAEAPPLDREILKDIFAHYGERDLLIDDEFIDNLIRVASKGKPNPVLDVDTFLQGLTHDIALYDVKNESKFQTHYEDVFGLVTSKGSKDKDAPNTTDAEIGIRGSGEGRPIKRLFTFPQIDFLTDSFRSRTQYICVWMAAVLGYLFWFRWYDQEKLSFGVKVCSKNAVDLEADNNFGCKVGQSVVQWFVIMLSMIFIVAPVVMILSLGNNINRNPIAEILAAITGIIVIVMLPNLMEFDWVFMETSYRIDGERDPASELLLSAARVTMLILGAILLLQQALNILRVIVPDSRMISSKTLTALLRGSVVRSEFGLKQAGIFKVHNMVKNALDVHATDSNSKSNGEDDRPNIASALLNYTKISEKKESSDGFIWAWKTYLSGRLIEQEGIWLPTKMLAANIASILITFFAAVVAYAVMDLVITGTVAGLNSSITPTLDGDSDCFGIFSPDRCYYIENNGTQNGLAVCQDIQIANKTCAQQYVSASGPIYDSICEYLNQAVDELPPPASLIYTECPNVYFPYPNIFNVFTSNSNLTRYCGAPILGCSEPRIMADDYYEEYLHIDVCVLGNSYLNPAPFQFIGDACMDYPSMEPLLQAKIQYEIGVEAFANRWFPKEWQLRLSVVVGIFFIFILGLGNALSTVPSMIMTTLKFRSGAIPSLRDPYFKNYRKGVLATTYLLGGALWGALLSSAVIFFITLIITFLFAYQVTQPYMLSFASLLIGISVTLTVKIMLSMILNKYNFVAFYRKHPLVANLSSLFFECWHLSLTVSYLVLRFIKLMIIVVVYIGRFDVPILAQGVGEIGPVRLDAFPFIFKQGLLAVDAHRHPYLERLGQMYLMKLKHGENFARKTGSIWRLLFVFALFPWLRQYRILKDEDILESSAHNTTGNIGGISAFQAKIAILNQKIQRLTEMNKNSQQKFPEK